MQNGINYHFNDNYEAFRLPHHQLASAGMYIVITYSAHVALAVDSRFASVVKT